MNEHDYELKLHCGLVGCPSVVVNGAHICFVRVHCTHIDVRSIIKQIIVVSLWMVVVGKAI